MSDTIYYIYKHTSITTGKSYIGFTSNTINDRWKGHISAAISAFNKNKKLTEFQTALLTYPRSGWVHEEIQVCDNPAEAKALERFHIKECNSLTEGYNMTKGGNAGCPGKDNGMYGKTHTDEVKQKLSQCAVERFKDKSYEDLYGKEKSDQLRQKRSDDMKRICKNDPRIGTKNPNAKRVHIKGFDFELASNAAEYFGVSRPSISRWITTRDDCYHL